ncbi:sensor histidine kinase [Gaoshiqia sp. Z1-71]|uniref:sensor histidine kinase n=1 Tax=Gaoshiqia hydrogeniformans TaxID=3290090 RepID=UPI003BF8E14F
MKSSLKITLIYLSVSFLWILFSDRFVQTFTSDVIYLSKLQTYKGWFFIFITSVFLFILIDNEIRRKNKVQDELRKAKIKAEESDRLKTAFLSNMSHEIRTPLNGILGFSNLLCEDELPPEKKQQYIELINRNNQLLLKIINDIIEISKIQENMISVNKKTIDLHELINNLHRSYLAPGSVLQEKNLEFRFLNEMEQKPFFVDTDPDRLNQILANLIENAIKYTEKGSVSIGFRSSSEQVNIFVQDTGPGIPKDRHSLIFERFKQSLDATITRNGFGLGLSISKGLAEALNGRIELESEVGKGSTFTVKLPYSEKMATP